MEFANKNKAKSAKVCFVFQSGKGCKYGDSCRFSHANPTGHSQVQVQQTKRKGSGSSHNVKLSRALSRLLRHSALKEGLKIRPDGFVQVNSVLSLPRFSSYTLDDLKAVVTNNDKQRFKLSEEEGIWYIRANQGHSMKGVIQQDLLLSPVKSPDEIPVCVHGTNLSAWNLIRDKGLSRMTRNHIHFACGLPHEGEVISGMRKSCQVHIFIDVEAACSSGIKFYRSDNNVILSPGIEPDGIIPPKFFKKVNFI